MQRHGGKARLLQLHRQLLAFHLRAGKHDGLVDARVAQPVVEQAALVLGAVGPVQLLLDVGVALLRAVDLHPLHARAAFVHHAQGQLLDARRKGGAEHHGLLALGRELVDFGQGVGKAQVEHAVGLVHHQKAHLIQLDLPAAGQVEQAARRGHHQIGVLQLGNLHLVRHAADHGGNAQAAAVLDQVDGVGRHLLRQLARGAQHQSAGHGGFEVARFQRVLAARALGRRLARGQRGGNLGIPRGFFACGRFALHAQQRVQNGQQEGRGLAAAGLAADHQVVEVAFGRGQRQRNGALLHGGGLGKAQIGDGRLQLRRQAQRGKRVVDCYGFSSCRRLWFKRERRIFLKGGHKISRVSLRATPTPCPWRGARRVRWGAHEGRPGFMNRHPPSDCANVSHAVVNTAQTSGKSRAGCKTKPC